MNKMKTKTPVRVLLVEDDAVDRLACRRALTEHPDYEFDIIETETGRQGALQLLEQRPDLVLLDYRLPDQDGLEFLAELARENGEPAASILMLTGSNDVGVAVAAMKLGACDFLVKDSAREYLTLLLAVLERALRKQRLHAEKRAAEARYRALVEQIPAIVYTAALDVPGQVLYISPQVRTLGYSADEWLAEGLLKHVHPGDHANLVKALVESCAEQKPLRCEYRLFTRGGETRWFLDEATVVRDAPGAPLFLQGTLVDITPDKHHKEELEYHRRRLEELVARRTAQLEKQANLLKSANGNLSTELDERRRTERLLRASEERFRLLLESTGEGIYGLDTKGRCIFVNDAALAMLGYSRDDLIGVDTHSLIHGTRADGTPYPMDECRIYNAFRSGETCRGVTETAWRNDGSSFPAEYSAQPIRERGEITGAVLLFRDVTEARAQSHRLSHQATHDALTGLVNRQEFERRLMRVLEPAQARTGEHALCYLDLDKFKEVNDSCGHAAGDELLRQISALLQDKMRARDTLARLGGDEFGILLEHCPLDRALCIADDLRLAIGNFRFVWQERAFSIGVSIGVVELTTAIDTLANALRAADAACYTAKDTGRNRIHVHRAEDMERGAQLLWVPRLTQALDNDRFELCYQSIATLGSSPMDRPHYEILLRLLDEHGGYVEPNAFIPAAERCNLMPAIDRWVLRHALTNIAALHAGTPPEKRPIYAINLSGSSLSHPGLAVFIGQLLAEHDVPSRMLCIEIKGNIVSASLARISPVVQELKKLGCLVALDNFGGGLHSFTQLKSLPVDFLKIDGSFVRGIAHDGINRAIADAINRVAHALGIQTVAECTENDDALQTLRELGIDHAQGYVVMNPQPLIRPTDIGSANASRHPQPVNCANQN